MIRRKTTMTRPDKVRLLELTQAEANQIRWSLFINELRREIAKARVVEPRHVSPHVVTMNSRVRIRDVSRGQYEVYTLVYPEEADLILGRLSILAPLGLALLGARAGDVVRVRGGAGLRAIKVDAILHQPEAADRDPLCGASADKRE